MVKWSTWMYTCNLQKCLCSLDPCIEGRNCRELKKREALICACKPLIVKGHQIDLKEGWEASTNSYAGIFPASWQTGIRTSWSTRRNLFLLVQEAKHQHKPYVLLKRCGEGKYQLYLQQGFRFLLCFFKESLFFACKKWTNGDSTRIFSPSVP